GIFQCEDNSDETLYAMYRVNQYLRDDELLLPSKFTSYVNFHEYCNGFTHEYYFLKNETDKTDCNELCLTDYTLCDGVWNCLDGRDELDCPNRIVESSIKSDIAGCEINEHYCFKLNLKGILDLTCVPNE
ncbi:unnamed protein product, partial [Didymodactylos carnosus]